MIGLKLQYKDQNASNCPRLNRTMIGLKHYPDFSGDHDSTPGLNRTMIGLKLRTAKTKGVKKKRLNRTMIGLKLQQNQKSTPYIPGLNRTMIGLKPVIDFKIYVMIKKFEKKYDRIENEI